MNAALSERDDQWVTCARAVTKRNQSGNNLFFFSVAYPAIGRYLTFDWYPLSRTVPFLGHERLHRPSRERSGLVEAKERSESV